jgi:hypothetical protein
MKNKQFLLSFNQYLFMFQGKIQNKINYHIEYETINKAFSYVVLLLYHFNHHKQ